MDRHDHVKTVSQTAWHAASPAVHGEVRLQLCARRGLTWLSRMMILHASNIPTGPFSPSRHQLQLHATCGTGQPFTLGLHSTVLNANGQVNVFLVISWSNDGDSHLYPINK